MGKRLIRLMAASLLFSLVTLVPVVSATTIKAPYLAEQAIGKAPDIKVYMTGSKMKSSVSVSGIIEKNSFVQNGKVTSFGKSGEGICYYVLLDNSGSVNEQQFNQAKKQLVQMRKELKEKDKMILYTVGTYRADGEKKNVFGRTVRGSETGKKSDDCKKIQKIKFLRSKQSKTVLYRSLNEVLASQASPKMRTIVLLITDGEDDSKGKDIDKVSTAAEVGNATIPVYGILLNNDAHNPNKKKMYYTKNRILPEKNCRGYYYDCSTGSSGEKVKAAFDTFKKLILKETYIVNLKSFTNKTSGKSKLSLKVNNFEITPVMLDYSDYVKDDKAPSIVGNVKKVSSNSISFSLQDTYGVNEADLKEVSHYIVQTKSDENDGKIWTVNTVNIEPNGDEEKVTLTFSEDLYTEKYVLKCSGIRDNSQDANEMNTSMEFEVEDGVNPQAAAVKDFFKTYWWIGLIILVTIIGIIIVIVIRKKAVKVVEINPDELSKADTKMIRLTITDRSGAIKDVEWNVEGSLFVGRSDICNIFFDDDRLSKQHFVIEVNKMGCYIEDLESTNGTFVNGVKMINRRMLLDGDVITAGREKIVFHLPKEQPDLSMDGESQQ